MHAPCECGVRLLLTPYAGVSLRFPRRAPPPFLDFAAYLVEKLLSGGRRLDGELQLGVHRRNSDVDLGKNEGRS